MARLSHPNLVRLLDRGEDAEGPYLVMELVDGENLKARLRREGPLDPDEAARICAEVARALSYAHGQGVVHRDIKAQNVLLTEDGGVKLADFGIARLIETDGEAGLTKTDMLLGSADYLSPEQADGRPIDARTDIYSLGILLYECLTGVLPFRGEGFVAVAMKQCSEPLPDPRLASPARARVAGGLHDPRGRQGSRRPLPGRGPHGGGARRARSGHGGDARHRDARRGEDEGDTARRRRPRRRRAIWAVCLVALLLAGGGLAALLLVNRDEATAPPPVAAPSPSRSRLCATTTPRATTRPRTPTSAASRWTTTRPRPGTPSEYRDTPQFGGLKSGVGLILRLTAPAVATEMVVTSPTPGAKFEVPGAARGRHP